MKSVEQMSYEEYKEMIKQKVYHCFKGEPTEEWKKRVNEAMGDYEDDIRYDYKYRREKAISGLVYSIMMSA